MWAKKIQERLLNVRKRSARHEKKKLVDTNSEKVTKGKPGRKKKITKKSAIPAILHGETEETMESQRLQMVDVFQRGTCDLTQVKLLMDNTFPMRRRDVLVNNTRVWEMLKNYPLLKDDKGIQASYQNQFNLCITTYIRLACAPRCLQSNRVFEHTNLPMNFARFLHCIALQCSIQC